MNQSEYELGKEKYNPKMKKKNKEIRTNRTAEFEFADDAISLNEEPLEGNKIVKPLTENPYQTVNGKEELPCAQEMKIHSISNGMNSVNRTNKTEPEIILNNDKVKFNAKQFSLYANNRLNKNYDGNYNDVNINKIYSYCTLPKKKTNPGQKNRSSITPPKRITPDGTHIYYWCDISKKNKNGKRVR